MNDTGEPPKWQEYVQWCEAEGVAPTFDYYLIWLEDKGYDFE